jgi:prolyl-tRNA editing enzyme YbaK/EbsC (Cys-tRNA(Pro) deacylase)
VRAEFLSFETSVHTVAEAVTASGYPEERFTKSIVMIGPADRVMIAMVPGDTRASTERVRKALGLSERPRIAEAEEIERHLGQLMGGNSPLNASGAEVFIDPKVFEKDWIITGGGDDRSLVRIPTEELRRVVDHTEVRVRK